jgi:hypothetical protein
MIRAPHELAIPGPAATFAATLSAMLPVIETARALRDHAFVAMGMERLVSSIDPENPRSIRVAERLGAMRAADFDGARVWVHRPFAQGAGPARGHTVSIPKPDAFQTSRRGD